MDPKQELASAIVAGDESRVLSALDEHGATLTDALNESGDLALHLAIKIEATKLCELFLRRGKTSDYINLPQEKTGETALHLAAFNGLTNSMDLLLGAKAAVDRPRKNGDTALHMAAEAGHKQCLTRLLGAGAEIDLLNADGATALKTARLFDRRDVACTLVKAGADPTLGTDGKLKESEEKFTKAAVERAIAETTVTSVLQFQQELWYLQQKHQRSFQAIGDGDHGDCGGAALEGTLDEGIATLDARQRSLTLRAAETLRADKNFTRVVTALAAQARDRGLRDQPLMPGTRVNVPAFTNSEIRQVQAALIVSGAGILALFAGELNQASRRGVYERWEKSRLGANDHYIRFNGEDGEELENYPLKKLQPDQWSITPEEGPKLPDPELEPMPPLRTFVLDWVHVGLHDEGIKGEKCAPDYTTEEDVRKACTKGEHLGYYKANGELDCRIFYRRPPSNLLAVQY